FFCRSVDVELGREQSLVLARARRCGWSARALDFCGPASKLGLLCLILEGFKFLQFRTGAQALGRTAPSSVDSRKAVRNQLFAEIAFLRPHEGIKPLDIAAAHRICHSRGHGERLCQLLLNK